MAVKEFWKKESFGLKVGDWVLWLDEKFQILDLEGSPA